jgi:hypothetical protein
LDGPVSYLCLLLVDAQKYLDKFLKDHPDHPAAAASIISWGDSLFELGQRALSAARRSSEKQQKAKLFTEARDYFKQAGDRYAEAQKRFLARLKPLPADEATKDRKPAARLSPAAVERQEMETGFVQAQFKISLVKYHLGQTYDDPKNAERLALLKAAAKGFNDIFLQYRGNAADERCIVAHLWHGKTLEELGDEQTAMDVFDEVLVRETGASDLALAPLYTQATLFRYSVLRKQGKIEELIDEGSTWAETHKSWSKLPHYTGAVLEVARAYQELAQKATGEAQRKILQKAAILLADVSKIESPYKSEALLLRRDLLKQLGAENIGPAEFLALGDAALRENNLAEAKKNYEQALQKALASKDQKSADEAKVALGRLAVRQIQDLIEEKKYEEALGAAESLAKGDATDPNTIGAAELALRSAYFLGAASSNKVDAYSPLERIADFVKAKWPGRPVADTARMILAQSRLQKHDTAAALALFGEVKPESSRYPLALFSIAQIQWFTYAEEKKKENGRDEQLMKESAAKAQQSLQKCIDLLQKSLAPGRKLTSGESDDPAEAARSQQLLADARLMQSEIYLEGKEYQKALALLDPLAEKIKADQAKANDSTIAVFTAAFRAHLALGEAEKAAADAIALLSLSGDDAKATSKLVNIAKFLYQELKAAEAAVTEAQGGDLQNIETVTAKRDAIKSQFRKLVEPLGKRKTHSLSDLAFLGDICFKLDLAEEGGQIYQSLLDRAKNDPAFTQKNDKNLIIARSQLIGVLRSQGKLGEALKQADELIAKNHQALSPKTTRADILEDLAKQDPRKLDDAIAQWSEIRVLVSRVNPKPPEYFEVVYKIAGGLYRQYEKSKDQSKLLPAEQLLKSTLIQNAKLSGNPDLVVKYNELLKKIQEAKSKK